MADRAVRLAARERSSRSGPSTLEWDSRKREPLQARERPLRVSGPGREKIGCGEPGSIDPEARETKLEGSGEADDPALPIAVLSTVHAGGEQGWKSDHLEPFSFGHHLMICPLPDGRARV